MITTKKEFQTILTARLLLEREGQFLFLEQTLENGGGLTLPGGKVKNDEFAKKALYREVVEEVGIFIKGRDIELIHVAHRKKDDLSEMILFFQVLAEIDDLPMIKEPEKFQNYVWLSINELPDGLTHVLKHAFSAMHKGRFFSQYPKVKKEKISYQNVTLYAFDSIQ